MAGYAGSISFVAIVTIAVFAGAIVLQVFLSLKENRWAGLILPIVAFCNSLLSVFAIVFFTVDTVGTGTWGRGDMIGSAVYAFLMSSIPTVVLLAIYAACRGRRGKRRALEKMSVQDL